MIAVAGAGRWGRNYLRSLAQLNEDVKWLYSRTRETLDGAAKAANAVVKATTSYSDILNDSSVNAVVVATHASTHFKFAKAALAAGKHVLVEKPMALSSKEAGQLVSLAAKKKKILMCGHIHRFNPGIQKIRQGIGQGLFGKIRYIHSVTTSSAPREGMDVIWDFAPHDITIATFLLGRYPESISANAFPYLKKSVYDVYAAEMRFGPALASAFGSWIHPVKQRKIFVVGDKGATSYDDYGKKLVYHLGGRERIVDFDKTPPLVLELKHFLGCIQSGSKPLTDGAEGLRAVRVIEAIEKSARGKGKSIRLSL